MQANNLSSLGEKAAVRFLSKRGYDILEENYSCEAGSMDIIARDEETLVFCQVATRRASSKGFPEEVLSTPAARAKLEAVAITYLAEHPDSAEYRFRFDSIALIVLSESRAAVRHHINVFGATGEID